MKPNHHGIKDDITTYFKIKELSSPLVNPYLEISPEHNMVTLNKDFFTRLPKDIQLKYEVDQVFIDKDEYSSIYDNITPNCIMKAINGTNTCFFSYGETNSEKHSLLFGTNNSNDNITKKGIFPRLLESFLSKDTISISYSLMCVDNTRLIDLTNFLYKDLTSLTADDFMTQSLEIKQPLIITNIKKIPLKTNNELECLIKGFNSLYNYLSNLEQSPSSSLQLVNTSHFLYIIYLYDKNNNNQLLSNISLCELSSHDKLITKITNPNNSTPKSILNTKIIIDNTYTFECIKRSIKNLKLKTNKGSEKVIDPSTENAKVLIVLQKLAFSFVSTNFIIIGSILYNVGSQDLAKETLQFLFDCKKICEDKRQLDETQAKSMEKTKDDLIFNLQAQCKELTMENKQMSEIIMSKNELLSNTQRLYKKQIDKLKSLFSFEGDINVLLGGSEDSKEMKFVQNMRDDVNKIGLLKQQNEELLQQIKELKIKVDLYKNKNDIVINDQAMLNYVHTAKEQNQIELNKLKMRLDNAQEIIQLKEANGKLLQINEGYQKELNLHYEMIKKLPKAFEINNEHSKNNKELKDNLLHKIKEKNKVKMRSYQMNYDNELCQITNKYEGFLKDKEGIIQTIHKSKEELIAKYDRDKDILNKEIMILYNMVMDLISSFKTELNWKVSPQISALHYNKFLASRDNCKKSLEKTEANLNMSNLPETLKLIEFRKKQGKSKELYLESLPKFHSPSKNNSHTNEDLVLELKRENKELKKRIVDLIECVNAKEEKCSCEDKEQVLATKDKMRIQLENMVNDNTRKGIVINVHERVLNKLQNENMTIKEMLKKKLITEKVNYVLPSTSKNVSSKSGYFHKSKSTRDISTSYSNIKQNKKRVYTNESVRLLSS